MRRRNLLTLLAAAGLAGCAAAPERPEYNDTDVMFLQMSLEHARQGEPVVALAATRATDPAVRRTAADLRARWRTEAATMREWLTAWQRPVSPGPDPGAHAGHGDLHSVRASDLAELRAAAGAAFDRTALSLLLGHLHNSVATARMETSGGRYPPALNLAADLTRTRQAQIRRLLALAG
ncbi:DUF305 domain-containing protein [Jidongwangia harbinensis]|uniref:DUF305 domain-containing protein n=1 Tax=Jidongwangia harbinensis TaxID=2878561 RepID=UPI001CD9E15C|nr:DUF305 domain-containing protein [Jidongwangia harbinensis]MCA2212070.1 DUF305 domain-containing protein [Jidongwangia harbinensis]